MVICFRILAFITNFNEIGREQIRTAGKYLFENVFIEENILHLPAGRGMDGKARRDEGHRREGICGIS